MLGKRGVKMLGCLDANVQDHGHTSQNPLRSRVPKKTKIHEMFCCRTFLFLLSIVVSKLYLGVVSWAWNTK